jgi:hypothetical protein
MKQILHQPTLKLRRRLKLQVQPESLAEFGNGAEMAQLVETFPFRHPAAPRMEPRSQIIQIVRRHCCHVKTISPF